MVEGRVALISLSAQDRHAVSYRQTHHNAWDVAERFAGMCQRDEPRNTIALPNTHVVAVVVVVVELALPLLLLLLHTISALKHGKCHLEILISDSGRPQPRELVW